MSTKVAPPDGAAYLVTYLFANLAGLEEFRAANQKDASFPAWANQVAAFQREVESAGAVASSGALLGEVSRS